MVVTVVLRLLPGPLDSGELVGHVEHVSTGRTEPVRGPEEIVDFCRQVVDRPVPRLGVSAADQSSDAPLVDIG